MNPFTLILAAGSLALTTNGTPQQDITQPKVLPVAAQLNAPAPAKADDAAKAAVKVHYTYVGAYTYPNQVNIENTDNHRAVAVVIQTPNPKNPFQPYVDRFTVHPRQFQSVRYVMFQNSAKVIDVQFVN